MTTTTSRLDDSGGVWLGNAPEGAQVHLIGIDAGQGLTARLTAMGLVPGVELTVVRNQGFGPAVVEVKGTRLALGRGMAQRIRVK